MSSYFRWIKGGKKDDYLSAKPRSRSLDSKSLEASGIRLILQNRAAAQHQAQASSHVCIDASKRLSSVSDKRPTLRVWPDSAETSRQPSEHLPSPLPGAEVEGSAMHGISHLLSHHASSHHNGDATKAGPDMRQQDTRLLQELLNQKNEGKLFMAERRISRGSVSSTYSYGSSCGSSHGSNSSNHGSTANHHGNLHHHAVYHTIHGSSNHHQANYHHHPLHHLHHQQQASSGRASPTTPSPTGEPEKHHHHHHHHHSIQEMIRHFGRRLGHSRRQSECQAVPKKPQDDFRNRSQSLDGGPRYHPSVQEADCETTYKIYESILRQGNARFVDSEDPDERGSRDVCRYRR